MTRPAALPADRVRRLSRPQLAELNDEEFERYLRTSSVLAGDASDDEYVLYLTDLARFDRGWHVARAARVAELTALFVYENGRDPDAPEHVRLGRSLECMGAVFPGH